jgi:hypothetical protein
LIITLVFKKNANLVAKNWGKSQKIVIITSTPGFTNMEFLKVSLENCKLITSNSYKGWPSVFFHMSSKPWVLIGPLMLTVASMLTLRSKLC